MITGTGQTLTINTWSYYVFILASLQFGCSRDVKGDKTI